MVVSLHHSCDVCSLKTCWGTWIGSQLILGEGSEEHYHLQTTTTLFKIIVTKKFCQIGNLFTKTVRKELPFYKYTPHRKGTY